MTHSNLLGFSENTIYDCLHRLVKPCELEKSIINDLKAADNSRNVGDAGELSFKNIISNLSLTEKIDIAYEICMSTNKFDRNSGLVFIDRNGSVKFDPLDIFKMNLVDGITEVFNTFEKVRLGDAGKSQIQKQVDRFYHLKEMSVRVSGCNTLINLSSASKNIEVISENKSSIPEFLSHTYSEFVKNYTPNKKIRTKELSTPEV